MENRKCNRCGTENPLNKDYYYETAGPQEITYKIFHRGTKLESWSGSLNVGTIHPNYEDAFSLLW